MLSNIDTFLKQRLSQGIHTLFSKILKEFIMDLQRLQHSILASNLGYCVAASEAVCRQKSINNTRV